MQVVVSNNSDRRKLYSRLELLKMDIEEFVAKSPIENSDERIDIDKSIKDIEELSSQQRLVPLKGRKTVAFTFYCIVYIPKFEAMAIYNI